MSAQHRQNYATSPPNKEIASNNLKGFFSGAFICCSILGGITACQNHNSSVKDSNVGSGNSVINKHSTRHTPQENIGEKSISLKPIFSTGKGKHTSTAIPATPTKTDRSDRVDDSESKFKTPIFPQIGRNNLSEATRTLHSPNYNFSVDTPDSLIQEQRTPEKKINPAQQKKNPKSQKNSITKEQTNKEEKLIKAISKVKTPQIYQSQQLGFSFKYPKGYVVNKAHQDPRLEPGSIQQRIDVWSSIDYQAIKAGKFQGSELPANVSISVEENPKRLNASQWLKENNDEFGTTQNQTKQLIAGQKAVVFRSSGLYEAQNIVLPSKDGNEVIVISHAQNQNHSDRDYEKVFEQVVSSFELQKRK